MGVMIRVGPWCLRARSPLSPVTRKSAWLASASASRKLSLASGAKTAWGTSGQNSERSRRPAASNSIVLPRSLAWKKGLLVTSRSSAMRSSQATTMNFFRSHASSSWAGDPTGDNNAESRTLVSRMILIKADAPGGGSVSPGLPRQIRQSSSAGRLE